MEEVILWVGFSILLVNSLSVAPLHICLQLATNGPVLCCVSVCPYGIMSIGDCLAHTSNVNSAIVD